MVHDHEGGRHRHRRRMRRGDVKYALLSALLERPMHGYDIMQELEDVSGGRYRPSPGSVYPTLQMLEDGGFVTSQIIDGKRVYEIAGPGRAMLGGRPRGGTGEDRPGQDWRAGWDEMRNAFDPQTREKIRKVIDNASREIYTILAERG